MFNRYTFNDVEVYIIISVIESEIKVLWDFSANKACALLEKDANGEKLQRCICNPRLIIISMNNKYTDKEIEK